MPAAELNKLKVEELQKLLKDKGLATTGKKAELVQVLPRSDPPLLPLDDDVLSCRPYFVCSCAATPPHTSCCAHRTCFQVSVSFHTNHISQRPRLDLENLRPL